jgi:hypothetical protein
MTDGQSSSLSWYQATIWDQRQIFHSLPWKYGKRSNIDILERYQNKVLRCLVIAPWYARKSDIHRDPGIETVTSIIARQAISHENRLQHHVNEEASRLLNVQHLIRRLKRTKPSELVKQFDN